MTVKGFNELSLRLKTDIVWEWAFFITNCLRESYNMALFAYSDFFIEIRLNPQTNKTEAALGLSREEFLNRYRDIVPRLDKNNPFLNFNQPGQEGQAGAA